MTAGTDDVAGIIGSPQGCGQSLAFQVLTTGDPGDNATVHCCDGTRRSCRCQSVQSHAAAPASQRAPHGTGHGPSLPLSTNTGAGSTSRSSTMDAPRVAAGFSGYRPLLTTSRSDRRVRRVLDLQRSCRRSDVGHLRGARYPSPTGHWPESVWCKDPTGITATTSRWS